VCGLRRWLFSLWERGVNGVPATGMYRAIGVVAAGMHERGAAKVVEARDAPGM
jgi:hypothetical protein